MKEYYLYLYDRDSKLMVKAKRAKNRLYKVVMDVESTRCLQLVHNKDSYTARTCWTRQFKTDGQEKSSYWVAKV